MSRPEDQIVFEDLHGVNEDETVTIDLDADSKDDGITRTPAEQAADAGDRDDDDIQVGDIVPDEQSGKGGTDDDDASKAGGDDDYSKKVKARIGREQRAKRKAQDEASFWKKQAEQLAKDQYERDKKTFEKDIEQADSEIEQVQADLERAIEDGQTKDQVRLTNRLTDLKANKARAEFSLNDLSPDGNVQPFDGKISSQPETKADKESDKWMEERSDWYRQPGFEKATRLANRLDRELYKEGYDPDSAEYFEELDARMKKQMPDLYDDPAAADTTQDDDETTTRRRSPVAGVDQQTGRQKPGSSKVELTERDFANMRQFNLDVNDPEVLKEYARNKREAEQGAKR